ncbi:MAG: hypothetical protein AAGC43_15485 [Bacteroidota bacterium]
MYRSISKVLIVMVLLFGTRVFSHQPNQLTYTFTIDSEKLTLKIYFTPKTLLDILEFVQPELRDVPNINLYDHTNQLRDYFGERILLNGHNLKNKISFGRMDLLAHDAYMTFILPRTLDASNSLEIEMNSLTDLYSRLENFVFVKQNGQTTRYLLTEEQRVANWIPNTANDKKQLGFVGSSSSWLVIMFSVCFFCLSMVFLKGKIE